MVLESQKISFRWAVTETFDKFQVVSNLYTSFSGKTEKLSGKQKKLTF